jgi:hypothetical protein
MIAIQIQKKSVTSAFETVGLLLNVNEPVLTERPIKKNNGEVCKFGQQWSQLLKL